MRENREYKERSQLPVVLAILGGAAAGAILTMLTAPKSGRETRHQLGTRLRRSKKKASHIPEEIKVATSRARDALDRALADVEAQFR